jgi:hypothetical protein
MTCRCTEPGVRKSPMNEIAVGDTRRVRHALSETQERTEFADGIFWTSGGREWPHNFGVMARGLLTGDLMFRTTCEFSDLHVAKIARSATLARSICRLVLSGMVRINFSRPKMSAANEANVLPCWSRYFVIRVVGGANDNAGLRIDSCCCSRS